MKNPETSLMPARITIRHQEWQKILIFQDANHFGRRDNEWFYREMPDITRDKIRIFNGKSDLVEYDVFRVREFDICCRSPVYIQSIGNDGSDDCLYQ